jgi:hypothetical protein
MFEPKVQFNITAHLRKPNTFKAAVEYWRTLDFTACGPQQDKATCRHCKRRGFWSPAPLCADTRGRLFAKHPEIRSNFTNTRSIWRSASLVLITVCDLVEVE